MTNEKIMFNCDVCGRPYQHGPHRFEGNKLDLYGGIMCCDTCWKANWDGWAPHLEPKLLKQLQSKGLPVPARNSHGWLPRS